MGEEELVRSLQQGDEAAFAEVVQRYHGRLVRFAATFVTRLDVAEDVTQETWIAMLRGIHGFEGRASLKTWLFQICANRARTTAGAEHRFVPIDTSVELQDQVWRAADFTPDGAWAVPPVAWPESTSATEEAALVEAVHGAIEHLPAAQRQVVTLRDVEGLAAPEVCDVLGISPVNQRVLLHRGRAGVRRTVDRGGFVR